MNEIVMRHAYNYDSYEGPVLTYLSGHIIIDRCFNGSSKVC